MKSASAAKASTEAPPEGSAPAAQVSARHPVSLGRALSVALTIVIGIAATLALFFSLLASESARLVFDFRSLASDRGQAIGSALAEDIGELQLIGSYVSAANELAGGRLGPFAQEFRKFVGWLSTEPDTVLVAYVARISNAQRGSFEALGRAEVDPSFRLLERGPGGNLVPSATRAEYFPVVIAEPLSVAPGILGLDLATEPDLQKALEGSIATGKIASSAGSDLPLPGLGAPIIWQLFAIYGREVAPGVLPRRSDLLGVAVAALRLDQLVENALKGLTPAGIDLELSDPAAASGRQRLYFHRSRTTGPGVPPAAKGGMSWPMTVDLGDRTWTLTAYSTPGFLDRHRSRQPWIVLFAGLLLTAAAGVFLAGRLRRARWVESLVDLRTHDLALEVAKHRQLEGELATSRTNLGDQVERLNQQSREILLLNEMGDTLQACLSIEEAFPVISLYLPRIFPATSGALYMHEPAGNLFVAAAEWGATPPGSFAFKAEDCWALRRGKTHVVNRDALALPCGHASPNDVGASLCIPLAAIGKTIGLFHVVGSPEDANALTQSAADRVGLALSNLMLRSDLRKLSIHDPLTGLFNRRYMEETLEIETHRAERKGTTIGVIMLDIDYFKAFNDGFGHTAGDDLLRALGGLVSSHLRAGDIACRFGGEEPVLILPEASVEGAAARAEDLRTRVKALEVQSGDTKFGPVTISLGVAVFPRHARGRDALLAAADACLYKAKEAGRDRVVVAVDG